MAEFVQQRIEEMIPELEEMVRTKMFTKEETSIILRRRRAYEYKLRKLKKSLSDHVSYIRYEQHVLLLIKARRRQNRCKVKITEIDVAIIQRIHRLFRQATKYFPNDLNMWMSHIEFATKRHQKSAVYRIYSKALRLHNHNASLWTQAAIYHFQNGEEQLARKFFHQGLRFNKSSQHLWLEYFRFELLCCDKARKRLQLLGVKPENIKKSKRSTINGQIAFVVFKEAFGAIPGNIEFLLKFIPICRLVDFTEQHEENIFALLINQYEHNELLCDALAQRKFHHATKQYGDSPLPFEVYQDCFQNYEESLDKNPSPVLFTLYLEFILRVPTKSQKIKHHLFEHLERVFEHFSQKQLVSADHFLKWVYFVAGIKYETEALKITELAVKNFPKDLKLWCEHLGHLRNNNVDFDTMYASFKKALDNVRSQNTWILWDIFLDFALERNPDSMDLIFKEGMSQVNADLSKIRVRYLKWLHHNKGIVEVRAKYKEMSKEKPVSLDFYSAVLDLERSEKNFDIDSLRIIYEDVLQEHGSKVPDFWAEYILLESTHPKGKITEISTIHFRAKQVLQDEMLEDFNLKYTLLRNNLLKV
ncbi:U3 small nucleolar RNA-associated protein 6 homolog [Argonauta hians]